MIVTRRHASGLTLIEALATMIVVAVLLPVVLRGISMSNAVADHANHRVVAGMLAQAKMDELIVTKALTESSLEGDFQTLPSGFAFDDPLSSVSEYRWQATVEEWNDPAVELLKVTVRWDHMEHERSVTLTTLIGVD